MNGIHRSCVMALLSGVLLTADAAAQAPQVPGVGGPDSAELLVKRINDELKEVDAALARAADADTVARDVSAAKASHLAVIRDIEELIKQVKYQKSSSSSSSGGGGESSSQGEGLSGKPESRPSDGSSAPKPSGGKPQDKAGEKPKDGSQGESMGGKQPVGSEQRDAGAGGNEQAGEPPPPDPVGRFTRTDTDARWGVLPPKLQERLMNLHVDDVPERYRVWLEAYIRALNSREQEGSTR